MSEQFNVKNQEVRMHERRLEEDGEAWEDLLEAVAEQTVRKGGETGTQCICHC